MNCNMPGYGHSNVVSRAYAIEAVRRGRTVREVAREMHLDCAKLSRWCKSDGVVTVGMAKAAGRKRVTR